jgi:thiaminase (transcriptional activator TenA)
MQSIRSGQGSLLFALGAEIVPDLVAMFDGGSKMSFSERMRSQAQETWDAVLRHRFFHEIARDTIDDRVFARYLGIEYAFVDSAAAALGYAVGKAPSFLERRRLAIGLYGLVTDQEQFFVNAFERIGEHASPLAGARRDALAAPLHDLFLGIARDEGYEEIVASSLAAEWMYLTWCSKAAKTPSSRQTIREWVLLHIGGPFVEQVDWMCSEIDLRGPSLEPERQGRLCSIFAWTLAAEISFHDSAYSAC